MPHMDFARGDGSVVYLPNRFFPPIGFVIKETTQIERGAMKSRRDFREIANDNLEICHQGIYESYHNSCVVIEDILSESRRLTKIIHAPKVRTVYRGEEQTVITFRDETTLDAILRLAPVYSTEMAVLNFASATNPGGGYLRGGSAQEESLCRASTLHHSLTAVPEFYRANRQLNNSIYHDALVYSPQVLIIRDQWMNLLNEPQKCSFLTCPAPNRTALRARHTSKQLERLADQSLRRRIQLMIDTTIAYGHQTLILGAWGCGVFGNAPDCIASLFAQELQAQTCIKHVHFAIPRLQEPPGSCFESHFC